MYIELWEGQGLNNDTTKCNSMSKIEKAFECLGCEGDARQAMPS